MANTKKTSSGKKMNNSAKKAAQTRKKNAEMAERRKKVTTEVYLWVCIAVALFLFLSNFGICGIVGDALRNAMLGLFGTMGYVFPIILAVVIGLVAYNNVNIGIASKVTALIMLFLDCGLLFHLFSYGGIDRGYTYFYYRGAEGDFGGGIIGGFFGKILHSAIGLTGTYIIASVILIISMYIYYKLTVKSYYANVEVEFLSSVMKISDHVEKGPESKEVAKVVGQANTGSGFLYLLVFISLNLGIVNLLPIPPLDGGKLLFILIEAIIRRKPNPKIEMYLQLVGMGLLVALMVFVTFNDITRRMSIF